MILLMALAIGGASALVFLNVTRPRDLPLLSQAPTSGYRFSFRDSCDEDHSDQRIGFTRTNQFLRADVSVVMNCSYHPTNPQVLFTPRRVILAIEEVPAVDGYAAACLCSKHLTYDLYRPITAGTSVVLQQEGEEVAHGSAP
jgi:hypothetical protein